MIDLANYFRGSLASVGLSWRSTEEEIEDAAQHEFEQLELLDDEHDATEGDVLEYLTEWVDNERAIRAPLAAAMDDDEEDAA